EFAWPHYASASSHDGRFLAVGTTNHGVKVWDVPAQRLFQTLTGHPWHAYALDFSYDDQYLASSSWAGDIRVWNVATGVQAAGPMEGHGSGVLALRFSPDAKTVVTSGHDQTVRF